jgi:mRNA interferase MazF
LAKFVKGEVVVIPFPFSDLTQAKRRPALILTELEGDDLILCQITSKVIKDKYAIPINDDDFEAGGLKKPSNIRPNRIFTADIHLVLYRVGTIKKKKLIEVIESVIEIIRK